MSTDTYAALLVSSVKKGACYKKVHNMEVGWLTCDFVNRYGVSAFSLSKSIVFKMFSRNGLHS